MADKYISVETAKTIAAVRHSDPIIRSAIDCVLDATPSVEFERRYLGRWEPSSTYNGFCSCSKCGCTIQFDDDYWPFCPQCGSDMDGGADNDAKRAVPTNADRLRSMDDGQLADFLHDQTVGADAVWNEEFSRVFCDDCEACGENLDLECPHGRPVDWWLRQEVSDGE